MVMGIDPEGVWVQDSDAHITPFTADEELALDYSFDSDLRDYHKLYWETEFKPVAQKLLQRIQNWNASLGRSLNFI